MEGYGAVTLSAVIVLADYTTCTLNERWLELRRPAYSGLNN